MSFDPVSFEVVSIDHMSSSRLSVVTISIGGVVQEIWFEDIDGREGPNHKHRACEFYRRLVLYERLRGFVMDADVGGGANDPEWEAEGIGLAARMHLPAYQLYGGPGGTPIETTEEILAKHEERKKEETGG